MVLVIESASMVDFHGVNTIVKEGQVEHTEALPYILKKVEQVMPESYFQELLKNSKRKIFVAKEKEEVIGFAVMEIKEATPFESMTPRKYAYMNDFGIKHSYQRKGVGRVLFNVCIEWAKNQNVSSLELNVWEFNQKAISFYENLGMKSVSTKMTLPL